MSIELSGLSVDLSFLPADLLEQAESVVTDAWNTGVSGLQAKNRDLIAQQKELKEQVRSASDGNSAEAAIRLSEMQEKLNTVENDLRVAQHNNKQSLTKLENAEKKAVELAGKHDSLVKTTALTEELGKAGVQDPALLAASRALLMQNVTLADDGALLMGEKSLSEAMAEWKDGEGKAFRTAGTNGGGNAHSNGGGASFAGSNPFKQGDGFNLTKQNEILMTQPELAAQLQAEAGPQNAPTLGQ